MSSTTDKHGKGKHEPHYELPSAETLKEAGELTIRDEHGKEIPFKSLYEKKPGTQQLIIFVRHFFCGSCGEIAPIPSYRTRTMHSIIGADNGFPIYTDSTRALYAKLSMLSNMDTGETAPSSVKKSALQTTLGSVKNAVMSGTNALAGGNTSQNGGEVLFAEGELVWFKRMRHTQDHTKVVELKEVLGLM